MDIWSVIGLLALILLVILGVPIFLAMFVAVILILFVGEGTGPISTLNQMFGDLSSLTLLAIPLFLLVGNILAVGGAGRPLMRLMNSFLGHLPGGPAYAVILANIVVAAMCASPIAGIAAFGPLMIPLLKECGYSERFAYGLIICSATLEPLIPPSVITIMYSYIAAPMVQIQQSPNIITLWTASIIPGLVLALLLAITVYIHTRRGHFKRLPPASWSERWAALKQGWSILLMPVAVLLPLYAGWANATESAAIGLVYVCFISVVIFRGMDLRTFWGACHSTMRALGTVFVIIMGAVLLMMAVKNAHIPQDIAEWLGDLGLAWYFLIFVILIAYILMGMFLDPSAIVLISVPLLLPSIEDVGFSVIVFGIFATLAVNLANITPPYGLVIFATMGVLNKPYGFIVRSILLFIPALVIGLLLVAFIPGLCTWLPEVTNR
ncbi:TRAP transporter large permease [Chloroflexota bacterium]